MNFEEAIYKQVELVRNDLLSGSSTLALYSLDIVTAAIDLHERDDNAFVLKIANMLEDSKPALAAVRTVCNYALQDFQKTKNETSKYFSIGIRNKLLLASEKTVKIAYSNLFNDSKTTFRLATCSYSSNVLKVLKLADKHGLKLFVYLIDSVWQKRNYANLMADELKSTGILCKVISIDDFNKLNKSLDFSLIGADGFDNKNNVVNGLPSKKFAIAAKDFMPFYVVAESFKKVDFPAIDDGFEYIESRFITDILSDDETW